MTMNPILLQKQLKENASDLQDFYKDLKIWGDEMRLREESSSSKNINSKVKSIAEDKKKQRKTILNEKKVPVKNKIGSTDYKAWDKFDADAECEKIDQNDSEESDLTDEIDENLRDQAFVEKEKGNKFVKNKKWDEAIVCYTKAIDCYRFDPVFYANRALCYLKKNQMSEAEIDCNMSLKLDSSYVKAYQRRAVAREALNKLEEAEIDLRKVLDFESNNKESIKALEDLQKKLKIKNDNVVSEERPVSKFMASRNQKKLANLPVKQFDSSKAQSFWPSGDSDVILVKAIKKSPHLQSKKPLMRVDIKETLIVSEIVEKQRLEANDPQLSKQTKNNSNSSLIIDNENNIDLKVPKTSVQFYLTWQQLKSFKNKYNYLKLIGPEQIPGIFKETIESNVFSGILEVLTECYITNNDAVFDFLLHLTAIKRFSTIIIFITANDKNNLWKLIDYVKNCENKSKDEVEQLISKFEL